MGVKSKFVEVRQPTAISKFNNWLASDEGISTSIMIAGLLMVVLTAMQVRDVVSKTRDLKTGALLIGLVFSAFFEFGSYMFAIQGDKKMSFLFAALSVIIARGTFTVVEEGKETPDPFAVSTWTLQYLIGWVMSVVPPLFIWHQSHKLKEKQELNWLAIQRMIRENPEEAREILGESYYTENLDAKEVPNETGEKTLADKAAEILRGNKNPRGNDKFWS